LHYGPVRVKSLSESSRLALRLIRLVSTPPPPLAPPHAPPLVRLGRERWPDTADRLLVCDAANLHLLGDESFDWVHSQAVAEHWPAGLVRQVFLEVRRVLKPGGHFFCSYDSQESCAAQGLQGEEEPTHVCIRPEAWWEERIRQAGFRLCSRSFEGSLRDHALSFLPRYAWSWFVARKNRPRGERVIWHP
jgi:SAM-dependent methyltransferase